MRLIKPCKNNKNVEIKRSFQIHSFSSSNMVENYTMRERMSGAINALSISPEGNSVVVAGRESN